MYKFENEEGTIVRDLETGQCSIHKGAWLWRRYQKWVDAGGITGPFKTPEELAEETQREAVRETERQRRVDIDVAVENGGMKSYTVAQVDTYLENQLGGMTLSNGDKLILFNILKKIAHRVL